MYAISLTALVSHVPQAKGAFKDVANIEVGGSLVHDSNIFRTPSFAAPQADTIYTGIVGLHINKPYAQQQFLLDISENAIRYEKSPDLDYDSLNYRAAWLWHYGPRVNGTLETNQSQTQVPFQDTNTTTRNLRTTKNYIFNADGEISAASRLLFGVTRSDQTSEIPEAGRPDFYATTFQAGMRYVSPSANTVALIQRFIRGNYVNLLLDPNSPVTDDFKSYESELQAAWVLNAKSSLNGRLTWLDRRSENFSKFDFSGLAGNVSYIWTPTSRSRVEMGAIRDIVAWQETFATNKVDNMLFIAPTWQASNKIALRLRLEHIHTDFRGGVLPTGESRRDTTDNALLGVEWSPVRTFTVGASVANERRWSNDINSEYGVKVFTGTASFKF